MSDRVACDVIVGMRGPCEHIMVFETTLIDCPELLACYGGPLYARFDAFLELASRFFLQDFKAYWLCAYRVQDPWSQKRCDVFFAMKYGFAQPGFAHLRILRKCASTAITSRAGRLKHSGTRRPVRMSGFQGRTYSSAASYARSRRRRRKEEKPDADWPLARFA